MDDQKKLAMILRMMLAAEKRTAFLMASMMVLTAAAMATFNTAIPNRELDKVFLCGVILFGILAVARYLLIKFRIEQGMYGTTVDEAKEVLQFVNSRKEEVGRALINAEKAEADSHKEFS